MEIKLPSAEVLGAYGLDERQVLPLGVGHINDTYLVHGAVPLLLQKINHRIFKNVPALIENQVKVISYLKSEKVDPAENVCRIEIYPAADGEFYFQDSSSGFWRLLNYIPHASFLHQEKYLAEAGATYGKFIKSLSGFSPNNLCETIPGFHLVEPRIEKLRQVLGESGSFPSKVEPLISAYLKRSKEMVVLENLASLGEIPLRITHNDTKADNILFDQEGNAISVIDLDTVMPGLVHYDFGDALRSLANPLAEDSDQFDRIRFDLESFSWFAKGFIHQVKPLLTKAEQETLVLSVPLFPYLMGLRFLTDYLEGNVYYKTRFPEHNLVRSQNQMRLLESIENNIKKIESTIQQLFVN